MPPSFSVLSHKRSAVKRREWHKRGVVLAAALVTEAVCWYACQHFCKEPYHTSALSGAVWIDELLYGHPHRSRQELGVTGKVFYRLLQMLVGQAVLQDTRYVTAKEQLAIFLRVVTTGESNRNVGERFQHSNETISRCVTASVQCFQ
jgi:hypothetical protein